MALDAYGHHLSDFNCLNGMDVNIVMTSGRYHHLANQER